MRPRRIASDHRSRTNIASTMKIKAMRLQSTARALPLCLSFFAMTGCSVIEINEQAEVADTLAAVHGSVEVQTTQNGAVNVVLYRRVATGLETVRQSILAGNGKYEFSALPGTYVVGAFVDANGDGV